jgi:hypothetical protein
MSPRILAGYPATVLPTTTVEFSCFVRTRHSCSHSRPKQRMGARRFVLIKETDRLPAVGGNVRPRTDLAGNRAQLSFVSVARTIVFGMTAEPTAAKQIAPCLPAPSTTSPASRGRQSRAGRLEYCE